MSAAQFERDDIWQQKMSQQETAHQEILATKVLLDFSLTVKAATLIFISGRGWAISSAKEGKSGFIYNLKELISLCLHFMKILTVYTLNSHFLTLTAHNHKMYVFVVHLNV